MPFPRSAGVLLHPTSLPGGHGIGDLGEGAYAFVEKLAEAGVTLWQILPIGPTGAANSPYQCLSSFAGNPLLISLERLAEEGLLTPDDLTGAPTNGASVNYDAAERFKLAKLTLAFTRFSEGRGSEPLHAGLDPFATEHDAWLPGYALYRALKEHFAGAAWCDWPDADLRLRKPAALIKLGPTVAKAVDFHIFLQYLFFRQWQALRHYANSKKIRILGDIPFYVAPDSADVWTAPEMFRLDAKGKPTCVAGCPPDYFTADGQLWGNPIYRWDRMEQEGFSWWIERIRTTLALVDALRIDHFRAFAQYWRVAGDATTARNGEWVDTPGDAFLTTLRKVLGELPILAEDLGLITPDVTALREKHHLPGMKVLQFAFCDGAEFYLPHRYEPNCVVYTATHDNDTSRGWYEATGPDYAHQEPGVIERERDKARRYLGRDGAGIAIDLIRLALSSVADTAVFPMQDLLSLDNTARMNRPGTAAGQWSWRLTPEQLENAPWGYLREMIELYQR